MDYLFIASRRVYPIADITETRALWITRWEYENPGDVKRIIANAAALRFNVLLFQVRGDGTVGYPSQLEPWTDKLGGDDPGWDPLALAIELAHAHKMQLHAWVNVYPAWMGTRPPTNGEQLYFTHPEWLMVDEYGRPQRLNRHYVWLSPSHPDVPTYLLRLCREIYSKYNIDGLHLDYIRYPSPAYSHDAPPSPLFYETTSHRLRTIRSCGRLGAGRPSHDLWPVSIGR